MKWTYIILAVATIGSMARALDFKQCMVKKFDQSISTCSVDMFSEVRSDTIDFHRECAMQFVRDPGFDLKTFSSKIDEGYKAVETLMNRKIQSCGYGGKVAFKDSGRSFSAEVFKLSAGKASTSPAGNR